MSYSWNVQLFLRLNRRLGQSRTADRLVLAAARDGIYLIGLVFGLWLLWLTWQGAAAYPQLAFTLASLLIAYGMSYASALLVPRVRPVRGLAEVRVLFETLGTWKTFPSDHTIVATVFAMTAWVFGAPLGVALFLTIMTLLVGGGRVLAGVHYPLDIVGGIVFGSLATFFAFQVLYR